MKDHNEDISTNVHVKKQITKVLWRFEQPDSLNFISKVMMFKKGIELPSDNYSFLNKCIMHANGTIDARGYKAWAEVGRKCLKGQNIHILAPRTVTIKDPDDEDKKKKICIGFYPIVVWPEHGTEGEPIDYKCDQELPQFHFNAVAKHLGIKIKQVFENQQFNGYFDTEKNEIALATPDEQTFCHELVHAVHNKFRKEFTGKNIKSNDPATEIIAEFSAVVLMNMLGKKCNEKKAYDYIEAYSKKQKKKTIRGIAELLPKMEKIIKYILEVNEKVSPKTDK